VTCVQDDEEPVRKALVKATTLTYEFLPPPGAPGAAAAAPDAAAAAETEPAPGAVAPAPGGGAAEAASAAAAPAAAAAPVKISLPSLHKYADGEDEIMRQLIRHYNVPKEARFDLLSRVRVARAFGSLEGRRRAVRHRLQALCLLLHSAPQQGAWGQGVARMPSCNVLSRSHLVTTAVDLLRC
jgi:hypothetical protein